MFYKNFSKLLFLISAIHFWSFAQTQTAYQRSIDLPFFENGVPIEYALSGGLNNPQFNQADLNKDGFLDLVIFDRSDDKLLTFLNKGIPFEIGYTYAPQYEACFPKMKDYLVMRDFNCDGIADIFTALTFDVAYYKGGFDAQNKPTFSLQSEKLTFFSNDNEPIVIADTDYPEIKDINGDGLLDILTFNEKSGGTVNWFKNISANCEGLDFEKADTCWGNFYESGNAAIVELNFCGEGRSKAAQQEKHPGSTLLCLDIDDNGVLELITGDINSNELTLLYNSGDANDALITSSETNFPNYNKPVSMRSFPVSFYLDINNDGKKDLLASPNSKNASESYRSSWLYINISETDAPQFNYVSDRFINGKSLDFGLRAYPEFVDINGDNLLDIIVGNYSSSEIVEGNSVSSLSYYQNMGTAQEAAFELITHDWAGLGIGLQHLGICPTFGDINGDGATDMVFGLNGTTATGVGDYDGRLFYSLNTEAPNSPMELGFPVPFLASFDVGAAAAPQLVDVNEDGLLDLVVGEFRGKLNYFKNIGSATQPNFEFVSDFWGNLDVKDPELSGKGYSVPKLIKLDGENKWSLIIGAYDGRLYRYTDIEENAENGGSFTLVSNNWCNIQDSQYSAPAFADINNDGFLEMLVGSKRGGLLFYEAYLDSIGTSNVYLPTLEASVQIFPNPSSDFISINTASAIQSVRFYDLNGRLVSSQKTDDATQNYGIHHFNNGIYLAEIVLQNGTKVLKKFIKL